jgi:hypothetical protein
MEKIDDHQHIERMVALAGDYRGILPHCAWTTLYSAPAPMIEKWKDRQHLERAVAAEGRQTGILQYLGEDEEGGRSAGAPVAGTIAAGYCRQDPPTWDPLEEDRNATNDGMMLRQWPSSL